MEDPAKLTKLSRFFDHRLAKSADFRQGFRHLFRRQPERIQKWLRKLLWGSSFRHMHEVTPGAVLQPTAEGGWRLRLRCGDTEDIYSRPLSLLRMADSRPVSLIATGPSALDYPWDELRNGRRAIWAVNGAPAVLASQGLKCEFLVVTDYHFAQKEAAQIRLAAEWGAQLIFSYEAVAMFATICPELLKVTPFYVVEKVNRWYALPCLGTEELDALNRSWGNPFLLPNRPKPNVGWSYDPLYGIFSAKTVTFAALQLIVWHGASDIGVIGLDLGGNSRAYVEEHPAVSRLDRDREHFILPSFECMAKALCGTPVRIVNHSKISVLPRNLVPENLVIS
ncbi:MAG: hypothetical protein QM627_06930 [Luteolibacter sp.]